VARTGALCARFSARSAEALEYRRFEFQILPQLLNHLGQDAADERSLDFATLCVFSCSASCAPPEAGGGEYVEEYVVIQ
jgi:hypothetical protein